MMLITDFSLWQSLAGGALIGLAAAVLLLCNGRVAGVSGVVGGLLSGLGVSWRLMFVLGMVSGGVIYQILGGAVMDIRPLVSEPMLIVAGLLVGIGTTLGSGCTSGHGVCGLARFSPRSLVATMVFMAAGAVTATTVAVQGWMG
ncbi:MAG: YeeE/YedE family protein [Motiliproteus sp.]